MLRRSARLQELAQAQAASPSAASSSKSAFSISSIGKKTRVFKGLGGSSTKTSREHKADDAAKLVAVAEDNDGEEEEVDGVWQNFKVLPTAPKVRRT
jgi:hypothetical protein